MKWNELDEVMHDNDLDTSDDDVIVYEYGTGDFHEADVIEFEFLAKPTESGNIYISINDEEEDDE